MADLNTPDGYTEIFVITNGNSVMEIFVPTEVVNNKIKISALRTYFQDNLPALIASNTANIIPNTVHRGSNGNNHSNVVLNNAHRISDGNNHSNVVSNNAHRISDGNNHSNVVLNNAHRISDGTDHSDVVDNTAAIVPNTTHRGSDGSDHGFIDQPVTVVANPTFNILQYSSKRITSANYLHGASTENVLFDKLSPFIPSNGNEMLLNGGVKIAFNTGPVSRATRTSSTVITIHMLDTDTEGINSVAITDGDATAISVTLSW